MAKKESQQPAPETEIKKTKTELNLECKLTDTEVLEESNLLAEALGAKDREEADIESYRTQAKAKIAGFDADISLRSERVRSRKVYRPVECEVEWDFKKGKKTYFRTDTGEVAKTEAISEYERQERLAV